MNVQRQIVLNINLLLLKIQFFWFFFTSSQIQCIIDQLCPIGWRNICEFCWVLQILNEKFPVVFIVVHTIISCLQNSSIVFLHKFKMKSVLRKCTCLLNIDQNPVGVGYARISHGKHRLLSHPFAGFSVCEIFLDGSRVAQWHPPQWTLRFLAE